MSKAVRVVKEEGLRGLWSRLKERRRKYFRFEFNWLVVYPIDLESPLPEPDVPVEVRRLEAADWAGMEALAAIYELPADIEGFLTRMSDREYCFVAYVDGSPVSYDWLSYKETAREYYNDLLHLQPGEVYAHDAYTIPAMRGKKIFPLLKAVSAREMAREHGAKWVISYVKAGNKASLSASRKLGGMRGGWFAYIRLFGRNVPVILRHKLRPL